MFNTNLIINNKNTACIIAKKLGVIIVDFKAIKLPT